ncbi:hypothetical protein OAL66_01760 [bacterium]|nr:hypothetical protein [bacterium]
MANKANLKTYPKVFIQQQNYGAGYAQVPNGVACNRGIWGSVSHKHFRIWVGLRSLKPRPRGYSKTEICRLLNIDRRNGLRDLEAMELQGLIEIDRNFLTAVDPDHGPNESPVPLKNKETTEQPTAKKEKEEKEEENSLPTAKATPRPVKVSRGEVQAANAPSPEELAENWNEIANKTGNAEDGYPIVQDDVTPAEFTPSVIRTLMFHASTNDVEPISIMRSVVYCSSWYRGLNGKGPAFVIGTVTDNETINKRFYDSWTAANRRKEKREEEQRRQWEADAPLREAEAARKKAEREEYERRQEEFNAVICDAYVDTCKARNLTPDVDAFRQVILGRYPNNCRLQDLSLNITRLDGYNKSPLYHRVYTDEQRKDFDSESRRELVLDVAGKLTYALCMLVPNKNVPTLNDLDLPHMDQLQKVLTERINCSEKALAPYR